MRLTTTGMNECNALARDMARRGLTYLAAGLNGLFGDRGQDRFGILMYHRVVDPPPGFVPPTYNVLPDRFEKSLTDLVARGFQFWPLGRVLAAARRGEHLPRGVVVLTFDDAYANVYTQAWPVLERLSIPGTVFLATAYLDSHDPFPFDPWGLAHQGRVPAETYRPLRKAECREMLDSGLIELGCHTHTHRDFRGRVGAFRAEVSRSAAVLGDHFGIDRAMFSFPWGSVHNGFAGDELADAAVNAGVVCGLTTESNLVQTCDWPFRWGRFNVFEWDTGATLAAKLNGWYGWHRAPRVAGCGLKRISALGPAGNVPMQEQLA